MPLPLVVVTLLLLADALALLLESVFSVSGADSNPPGERPDTTTLLEESSALADFEADDPFELLPIKLRLSPLILLFLPPKSSASFVPA